MTIATTAVAEPCIFCSTVVQVPRLRPYRWAVCGVCATIDPGDNLPVLELPAGTYCQIEDGFVEPSS